LKRHSVYCETHSPKPILKQFKDFDQILTFVADKIRILHEQGEHPLSEFAILYTKRSLAREQTPTAHELIMASIESRGIMSQWVSEDYQAKRSYDINCQIKSLSVESSSEMTETDGPSVLRAISTK